MPSSESSQGTEALSKPEELIVFGEVLFDCFPDQRRVLGGAPFNVAWALQGFGHHPRLVSAVGADSDGEAIRRRMQAWGLSDAGLQTNRDHTTGEVRVTFERDEPNYEICAPRAWDSIEDRGDAADGLIYHGLLALRGEQSRRTFEAIRERSSAKRFFDVNLRPPHYSIDGLRKWVRNADWLKLNLDELKIVLGVETADFENAEPLVERLRDEFQVSNVLLTGGKAGALISGAYGHGKCMPAPEPVRMEDTVGAGDSFASVTIHGILSGMSAEAIVNKASQFAAKVCAMQGATSDDRKFYQ